MISLVSHHTGSAAHYHTSQHSLIPSHSHHQAAAASSPYIARAQAQQVQQGYTPWEPGQDWEKHHQMLQGLEDQETTEQRPHLVL